MVENNKGRKALSVDLGIQSTSRMMPEKNLNLRIAPINRDWAVSRCWSIPNTTTCGILKFDISLGSTIVDGDDLG